MIKFVSDLWLVSEFLRVLWFPPPWYNWNIVESGVKHHNPNPLFWHILYDGRCHVMWQCQLHRIDNYIFNILNKTLHCIYIVHIFTGLSSCYFYYFTTGICVQNSTLQMIYWQYMNNLRTKETEKHHVLDTDFVSFEV